MTKKIADKIPTNVPREAFTVEEFCEAHRISLSFYYKLRNAGLGPRETYLLGKRIISNTDAATWRAKRSKESVAS